MNYARRGKRFIICIVAAVIFTTVANAQTKVYWTDASPGVRIQRSDLDGSNYEVLFYGSELVVGIEAPWLNSLEIDPLNQKVYWSATYSASSRIERANLDGTGRELLLSSGSDGVLDLTIDFEHQKIYWGDGFQIKRANLDGSNVETLVTSSIPIFAIAVDGVRRKIYWPGGGGFMRANLDGSNVEPLFQASIASQGGVDLDHVEAKVYWIANEGGVYRARADGNGTDIQQIIPPSILGLITDVKIDTIQRKIYLAYFQSGEIRRFDLDGSNEETVVSLNGNLSLALDAPRAVVSLPAANPVTILLLFVILSGIGISVVNRRSRLSLPLSARYNRSRQRQ